MGRQEGCKSAGRGPGRLPGGGAGKEMELKLEERQPGREAALRGRAPRGGAPGSRPHMLMPCYTTENGFTLEVIQKTGASHAGQGILQVCFSGWAALASG